MNFLCVYLIRAFYSNSIDDLKLEANFFKDFIFFFFSPKPPVHGCIFVVVGPSSCGMWDAALAWPDEWCHVRAQDPNQETLGCRRGACKFNHSATGPAPRSIFLTQSFHKLILTYLLTS